MQNMFSLLYIIRIL